MASAFDYGIPAPIHPRKSQFPDTRSEKKFLKEPVPELGPADQWKGVKILGAGQFGTVGLWKYVGLPVKSPRYIAVKTGNLVTKEEEGDAGSFENEVKWHGMVNIIQSQHIVRMVREPPAGAERVFLEYCELGTLKELLERRIRLAKPFTETSLWYFFDCLVDGLCVLAYGNEPTYDPVNGKAQVNNREHWLNIHHGDLKFRNVLLGERNTSHPLTPVVKLADFGEASTLKNAHVDNILYIGQFIASLATLRPEIHFAKMHTQRDDIDGWHPKGSTLACEGLRFTPYSLPLKQTVFECVYQEPKLRPSLLDLKERVQKGLRTAIGATPGGEPWEGFMPPGPETPEWDADAWEDEEPETLMSGLKNLMLSMWN